MGASVRTSLLLIALQLLLSAPVVADTLWDHNGSVMRLFSDGSVRRFYYEVPKPDLLDAGVAKGTLLFQGHRFGDRYVGEARRFSKNCPAPLPYKVQGSVVSERLIILKGTRRVYDTSCRFTGRNVTDKLVFTLSGVTGADALSPNAASPIPGSWATSEENCADPLGNGGVTVSKEALLNSYESGCSFEGGDTSDPSHWVMRGKCETEGEYEGGGEPPLVQIDLEVADGVLKITTQPGTPSISFAIKCPAKSSPSKIEVRELGDSCQRAISTNAPDAASHLEGPDAHHDLNGDQSVAWSGESDEFYSLPDGESLAAKAIGNACPRVVIIVFSGPTGGSERWYIRRDDFAVRHSRDSGFPGDESKYWGWDAVPFGYDPKRKY